MDFTIYSIGSAAYLNEILKVVTSITSTGGFGRLIQIGLLLGVLIMAFQAIFSGGKDINIGQLVVAGLLYALMFGPTVTVNVEGVYDNQVHAPINDVPIGIAAPGAIVSQIGFNLTNTFETAFTPPGGNAFNIGMTQGGGFADALKILNDVRRKSSDPKLMAAFDAVGGNNSNFRTSWKNYIRECTAIKIDRNESSIDSIYSADNIMSADALKFESELFGTAIIKNGVTTPYSCTDGFTELQDWTTAAVAPGSAVYLALAEILGISHEDGYGSSHVSGPSGPLTGTDGYNKVSSAMDALAAGASTAQTYVQTAILEPIFQEGMAGRYEDVRDFSTAAMINAAIDQRNIQWASEQTMFMSVVRPMLTFIEGFAFAITPFMAFIIVLGGFGIKLAIKYGQMLLWIQLWLPVLAITNFFLYMVANHDLAQIDNFATSFYGINAADNRLANWVAVGGMLAAATPILTLVLLTGSTYAMTSLAQRMQGGDHVNEKTQSPDPVQQGAVLNQMAHSTNDNIGGLRGTNADSVIGTLKLGQMAQSARQSSQQEMRQATDAFTGSLSQGFQTASTRAEMDARTEALSSGIQSTQTEGVSAAATAAENIAEKFGLDKSHVQGIQTGLVKSASTGIPAKLGSILPGNFSFGAEHKDSDVRNFQLSASTLSQYSDGASWSKNDTAALADTMAHQMQDQSSTQIQDTWGATTGAQLAHNASELRSASKAYSESDSLTKSFEVGQSYTLNQAGELVGSKASSREGIDEFLAQNPDLMPRVNELESHYTDSLENGGLGLGATEGHWAAKIKAITEAENYGGDSSAHADGQRTVLSALAAANGTNPGATGNPDANRGVSGDIATPEAYGSGSDQGINLEGVGGVPIDGMEQVIQHNTTASTETETQAAENTNEKITSGLESRIEKAPTTAWNADTAGHQLNQALTATEGLGGNLLASNAPGLSFGKMETVAHTASMIDGNTLRQAAGGDAHAVFELGEMTKLTDSQAQAFAAGYVGDDAFTPTNPAQQYMQSLGSVTASNGLNGAREHVEAMRYDMTQEAASANYSPGLSQAMAAMQLNDPNRQVAELQDAHATVSQELAQSLGKEHPDDLTPEEQNYVNYLMNDAMAGINDPAAGQEAQAFSGAVGRYN